MIKRILSGLIFIVLLSAEAIAQQAPLQPFAFTFNGRWNPSEDALLLDDNGLQDIQNIRKAGKHFKSVSGHTAINTTALSTYPYILNGYHFKKDSPAESHVIVYDADAFSPAAGYLYDNTATIPGTGDFSTTSPLYTPSTFTDMWRFSAAPGGSMVASNGDINLLWGGNEITATSFVTSSSPINLVTTNQQDYSEILSKNDTSNNVIISTGIDSYTKILLHMNGADTSTTFTDSSASAHSMTAVGDAQIDTSYFKLGTASGWFDGSGDYLTAPDSDDFYFGTNNFTISFWFRLGGISHNNGICGQYADANNYWYLKLNIGLLYFMGGYNSVEFRAVSGGTVVASYSGDPGALALDTWFHFEVSRSSSTVRLFVNGTSKTFTASTAIGTNSIPNITASLEVGAASNHSNVAKGRIDEFIIRNGIAWHTSNFIPQDFEYGINSTSYFLIGSKRPLQGVKFYVGNGNLSTSTLTVKEWQNYDWTTLTVTDGTASGGKSLAQTGSVTWTATGSAAQRFIAGPGLSLYWYQFYLDAGEASVYYVTVDAPIQPITNVWSGYTEKATVCVLDKSSSILNYTSDVGDESTITYADISGMSTSHALYMGFVNPMQAIEIYMLADYENTNAASLTLQYWNGSSWTNVPKQRDGTILSTATLGQYGIVSFSAPPDEQTRTVTGDMPLYYYKLIVSSSLDGNSRISEIRGVPQPPTLTTFKFSETFQNRLFLFNEKSGEKNKALYSDYNAPDIFNGSSSGELSFGDLTDLTAATVIYNVYMNTAIDQLLVTKTNETWRLAGKDTSEWVMQRMSANIGCVAPLSMVSAEVTESSSEVKRTVAIWQYDKGIVMSDGAIIVPISEDIKCYWDPNDSRYIPAAMQSRSVAWYDIQNQTYKLLIASGSTATYLNTELEYSLKYKEWTKIYRENAAGANPLQSGFRVTDTNGLTYTYGGGKDGLMYRLENGNTWNGLANITSYLHTKDLILDNQAPLFRKSTVRFIRTAYKQKTAATGNLTITHYGDRTATATGTSGQTVPTAISTVPTTFYNSQSCQLGPFMTHSFKFSQTTAAADGLELLGFGVYYEPTTTFRQ